MGTKAHSKIIEQTSGQMVKALKKYYIEQKKKKNTAREVQIKMSKTQKENIKISSNTKRNQRKMMKIKYGYR